MKIFIDRENKILNKKFNGKAIDLLTKLKINPETVIIVRNKELITELDVLKNSDNIEILSVISGG